MKITKDTLRELNIYSSYGLAQRLDNKIYINCIPADNGRLTSRYAYWKTYRLDFLRPENKTKEGTKEFTVRCREDKEPQLQKAIAWVKYFYSIEITDKDPFGGWQPKGTIAKLKEMITQKGVE